MTVFRLTVSDDTRDLDLESFRLSEADELMRLTGWDYAEWRANLGAMHADAIRFAWLLANRRHGTPLDVAFKDIDFDFKDFTLEVIHDEEPQPVEGVEGEGPTGPADSSAEGSTATT